MLEIGSRVRVDLICGLWGSLGRGGGGWAWPGLANNMYAVGAVVWFILPEFVSDCFLFVASMFVCFYLCFNKLFSG